MTSQAREQLHYICVYEQVVLADFASHNPDQAIDLEVKIACAQSIKGKQRAEKKRRDLILQLQRDDRLRSQHQIHALTQLLIELSPEELEEVLDGIALGGILEGL